LSERETQVRAINAATFNLAQAAEAQAASALDQTRNVLSGLTERIDTDGDSTEALRRIHKVLVRELGQLPQLSGLFIYDESGRWLASAEPSLSTQYNNSDRAYFAFHRNSPSTEMHIGEPIVSRSSGRLIIPVSVRINRPDGQFGGVILATLDVDHFTRFTAGFR